MLALIAKPMGIVNENEYCSFKLEDQLLVCKFKKGVILNLTAAKAVIELRTDICKGKSYPALILDDGIGSVTKEARDYFASPNGTIGVLAAAMVYSNSFNRMVARFFLLVSVNKLLVPTDIFSNTETAITWLNQYVEK